MKEFTILAWTPSFKGITWFGYGTAPFQKCDYSNCFLTADRDEYNKSDAILVNIHNKFRKYKVLPTYRPSLEQKWIMRFTESPVHLFGHANLTYYNYLFNATWTYHSKSDIWTNYSKGFYVKRTKQELAHYDNSNPTQNFLSDKDVMISWLVSHCKSQSKRESYVKKLEKYIPVNSYGTCSKIKCRKKSINCDKELQRSQFYLAFENSLCDEYITEKVVHAIRNNIIPVVMGSGDYLRVLPPGSYIDIANFKSPQVLAQYLLKVSCNATLYNSYMAYKRTHRYIAYPATQCFLCEYMNTNYGMKKTYPKLDMFWNWRVDCYKPSYFYASNEAWWL